MKMTDESTTGIRKIAIELPGDLELLIVKAKVAKILIGALRLKEILELKEKNFKLGNKYGSWCKENVEDDIVEQKDFEKYKKYLSDLYNNLADLAEAVSSFIGDYKGFPEFRSLVNQKNICLNKINLLYQNVKNRLDFIEETSAEENFEPKYFHRASYGFISNPEKIHFIKGQQEFKLPRLNEKYPV